MLGSKLIPNDSRPVRAFVYQEHIYVPLPVNTLELLLIMKSEGIDWKRDINVFLINKCSDRATVIRDKLASKHSIPEKNLSDMSLQLKSIMDMIKADVPKTDTPITEAKQESK